MEQDFHEAEIASGGVISAIAAIPCGEDFPMERKVRGFLQAALRIYRVPEEKIAEAIAFVSQFDFAAQARLTIDHMLAGLEQPV